MDHKMPKAPLLLSKPVYLSLNYDVKSIDCDFKIRNFSLASLDELIESPIFSTSDANETKWRIGFYPKGKKSNENKTTEYSSIYLKLVDCKDLNIKTSYTFSIIKRNVPELNDIVTYCFESKGVGFGFPSFFKYKNLFKHGYLINDTLHITCKLNYSTSKLNSYIQNEADFDITTQDTYKNLSDDISFLQEDKSFSDVCLEVDGIKFLTHKCILAARSSVFRAMFENDMKEKKEDNVKIQEMKPEVIKAMLGFIYTGRVDGIKAKSFDLLKAADMYDIKCLKSLCENLLSESLTMNNVVDTLNFADIYRAENLKRNAISFIKYNFSEVKKTRKFRNFKGSKSTLIDMIESITV